MSGPEFRDRLTEQQYEYRSVDLKYPGDKQFNAHQQQNKKQREARISTLERAQDGKARVTYDVWEANRHPHSRS